MDTRLRCYSKAKNVNKHEAKYLLPYNSIRLTVQSLSWFGIK